LSEQIGKEISNRTEIQEKLKELFPKNKETIPIDNSSNNAKIFSNTTESYNKILKAIQTLPKDILSDATTAFYKKLNESQPTLKQFQRFYNNLSMFKNDVTTMEAFNSMIKSFDGK